MQGNNGHSGHCGIDACETVGQTISGQQWPFGESVALHNFRNSRIGQNNAVQQWPFRAIVALMHTKL